MCLYSLWVLAAWLSHFMGFLVSVLLLCWPCSPLRVRPPWAAFGCRLWRPLGWLAGSAPVWGLASPCVSWAWVPLWGPCCSSPLGCLWVSARCHAFACAWRRNVLCLSPMWLKPRSAPVNGSGARLRSPPSFHCLLSQFILCCFSFSHVRNHGSGFIC